MSTLNYCNETKKFTIEIEFMNDHLAFWRGTEKNIFKPKTSSASGTSTASIVVNFSGKQTYLEIARSEFHHEVNLHLEPKLRQGKQTREAPSSFRIQLSGCLVSQHI